MIRREYICKDCEFKFERTIFEEEKEVKCPVCGSEKIVLVTEEEKKPVNCSTSSKYT
jgi:DNA-directed RNA polymerase subunit RPC12/RpoP